VTVLVTGATGFVGINVLDRLLGAGHEVVALAMRPLPEPATAVLAQRPGRLIEVTADVTDAAAVAGVLAAHRVARVLHGAAITADAARERREAQRILDVNLGGLAAVATAACRHGVERFVLVGSVATFGPTPDGAVVTEDAPQAPRTLYAITKQASEGVLARIGELHDLDWAIGRLGTVFGPWEYDTGLRDTLSAVHQVTVAALAGRPARLARPARRNWHYAADAADGLATLLTAPRLKHRVYNLGSPHVWTLADWCERLRRRFPAFAFTVGEGPGDVELYGTSDGGLLSWQRFRTEFPASSAHDLDAAFAGYLDHLAETAHFGMPA
jgi:nucleoside-diphosphate-sugar epimerase